MNGVIRGLSIAAIILLAGCAGAEQKSIIEEPPLSEEAPDLDEPVWHRVARAEDADRLARLDEAWRAGLAEARAAGFAAAIAREGELLKPDAALARAAPPPGYYRCRVMKLGTQGRGGIAYVAYKPFFCFVEAEGPLLTIVKQTGSQRPAGRLYPETDERMVFFGTLALGNEEAPKPYGEDMGRDMAGVVERVAPFRWRLVIPWPRHESKLDVFELVPVTQ